MSPEITIIPADPAAVREEREREDRRIRVNSQLANLYRELMTAQLQLEEDDRIIALLQSRRDQLVADIKEMEHQRDQLEEEKKHW